MTTEKILTCVYCGQQYPVGTAPWGEAVLTAHVENCDKHPLHKALTDLRLVRRALAGIVGDDTEDGLREMDAAIRILPAAEADKAVTLNAIHALQATSHRREGVTRGA